jgi:hypothetical protein
MSFLLLALVTHFTIHRRATTPDRVSDATWGATLGEKLAACLSLILWTAVVAGGRAIAFF